MASEIGSGPMEFVNALIKLKEHFPAMFEAPVNVEALKLRFETELAMQEQKIRLLREEREHQILMKEREVKKNGK